MSPVHLRKLGIPRSQPEDREGLYRTRRPGRGHLEQDGVWKDTEGNHNNCAIHLPTQQKPQPEDWKDMDQVLQLHQLPKDLFQWRMDNKRFNLASHWAELGASWQKICLKEIPFKDLMVITKGWNTTRQFRILEERENRIRENKTTIQDIEEQLNQTGPTLIPSGSQGVDQPKSPVASNLSGARRSVSKSHNYSQSQVVSRRRKGYKGKKKPSLIQSQRESDPMIQQLLELVKEVQKSHK
ncbi:hypothetical protein O181_047237 [Austropuccinia psidii MF-1]|uniref:Uncharacterized protein n=1 Tax=Austropuccinia psidii MF-1 TaxID=1389203 RepID=A0A9Q3HKF8_9BASI|nr:hypothetical protein [Austropuccinia psidii MF-1]